MSKPAGHTAELLVVLETWPVRSHLTIPTSTLVTERCRNNTFSALTLQPLTQTHIRLSLWMPNYKGQIVVAKDARKTVPVESHRRPSP